MAPAITHYVDPQFKVRAVKILPGQYYATAGDEMISTVLGSCVAACIRDTTTGIGGMNHFMLPHATERDSSEWSSQAARYGVHAMELLINALLKKGARRSYLEAKVFGGAAMIDGFSNLNVGTQNAHFVREFLAEERIAVTAEDLGGRLARKICYFPSTGAVQMKYLRNERIVSLERRYLVMANRPQSDVTLFE